MRLAYHSGWKFFHVPRAVNKRAELILRFGLQRDSAN